MALFEIGVFGSIAWDNIFQASHVPVIGERVFGNRLGKFIGGMAANQAIEAARYTENVRLIGKVGDDEEGRTIIRDFNQRGVDTSLVQVGRDNFTGQSFMYLVGEDYFSIVTQGANLENKPGEIRETVNCMHTGIILVSLEINPDAALQAIESAKEKGIETFLIPSPAENCTPDMLALADALILNQREAAIVLDLKVENLADAAVKLASFNGKKNRILLTMGSQGAVLLDGEDIFTARALKIDAVDPIGAGDAFTGAYAGCLAQGFPPQKALSIGCIAGALAASKPGPQSSSHTLQDVLDLYNTHYKNKGA